MSAALCERPLNGSDPAVWSQRHSSAGEKNMLLEVPQSQQVTTSVSKCVCECVKERGVYCVFKDLIFKKTCCCSKQNRNHVLIFI